MKKYVQDHEVEFFFIFTFAFSWPIWFLAGAFLPKTHDWGRVTLIIAYSPSLVGLLLLSLHEQRRETKPFHRFWVFFPLFFIFAATIMWLDSLYWGYPLTPIEVALDSVLAVFASFTIATLLSSARNLRTMQYPISIGKAKIHLLILAVILWPGIVWEPIQVQACSGSKYRVILFTLV